MNPIRSSRSSVREGLIAAASYVPATGHVPTRHISTVGRIHIDAG